MMQITRPKLNLKPVGKNYFLLASLLFLPLTIFLALLPTSLQAAPAENVLQNGGFETKSEYWHKQAVAGVEVKPITDPELVYMGDKSLSVKATDNQGIRQTATIDPNQHFFANANVLVKKGQVKLVVQNNESGQELSSLSRPNQSNWQSLVVNLPPKTTSASVTVGLVAVEDSEWYADNLVLHQIDFTPRRPINPNQEVVNPPLFWKGEEIKPAPPITVPDSSAYAASESVKSTPYPPTPRTYPSRILMAV